MREILTHYSRPDIQEEILLNAEDREVAIRYSDSFGKRPDILRYPSDILEAAKQGATSFHASEERWSNSMHLRPGMPKKSLDELRKGWDLVIDIDCDFLEYSKIAADLIIKAIKHFGVDNVSCKFSGRSGFHIGVCFESFPDVVIENDIKDMFPEGPRAVALFLKDMVKDSLAAAILEFESIEKIKKRSGKSFEDLVADNELNPYSVLGIDTVLISSRHLYRMPYSVNEKVGFVSVPVNPDEVLGFDVESAKLPNINISKFKFLDRQNTVKGEASMLLVSAFDHASKSEDFKKEEVSEKEFEEITEPIPEDCFPECMKKGLKGMEDGKKRFLFILLNFLQSVGWDHDKIDKLVHEWNSRNHEPLRETYVVGQLRYRKHLKNKVLPPNCSNSDYYKGLGLYCEAVNHDKCKNPVTAAIWNNKRRRSSVNKREKQEQD